MLKNTRFEYGSVAKFFHWLIALLIILMLAIGFTIYFLGDEYHALLSFLIKIHKSLGLTILLLITLRLIWKAMNLKPRLPTTVSLWERALAHFVHFCLYSVIFIMILVGWAMSAAAGHNTSFWWLFNLNLPIPKNEFIDQLTSKLHFIFAWILLGLIVIHILGAVKNYFYNKNQVLQRMLPFQSKKNRLF